MSPQTTSNGTLNFQTNIPETVSLAFAQGKDVQSAFSGDQVMFSLVDGRKMYLEPFVAKKIYEAGIGAHTEFTICKREVSHGNRRTVEFEITTHNETGTGSRPAPVAGVPKQEPVQNVQKT